ncbi:MAG: hypothetical protein ABI791_04795 [Acidobacteriota bacterium]
MIRLIRNKFIFSTLLLTAILSAAGTSADAQSVSQNFPAPVTSNDINGVIPARDIGDSRLTTYYYSFEGGIGDVFVNISTKNFTGDIDIFADNGLRPLSKIVVYADFAENETGRVIYLRKPEKLTLRIQGRSPGDDPASYRIKFAGSFVASKETGVPAEPELPKVSVQNDTGIRVNSVGTIIAVTPKPKPPEKPADERIADARKAEKEAVNDEKKLSGDEPKHDKPAPEVVVTEKRAKPVKRAPARTRTPSNPKRTPPAKTATARKESAKPRRSEPEAAAVDPLANIHLVILFKDGKVIERPMSEVFKFSVDKGVLTVISKDGSIGRYSILDVEKLTIQ